MNYNYPICPLLLHRFVNEAWRELWSTRLGYNIELQSINITGQMIGLLFEQILLQKLNLYNPHHWPILRKKGDKDLHFAPNPSISIEIKTSGQKGTAIYGNRSYALSPRSLNKSALFLLINYTGLELRQIRFGWLAQAHWDAQKSGSGQQAKLNLAGQAQLHDLINLCNGSRSKTQFLCSCSKRRHTLISSILSNE